MCDSISRRLSRKVSGCVLEIWIRIWNCSTECISISPNAGRELYQCEDVNQWCCQPNITNFCRGNFSGWGNWHFGPFPHTEVSVQCSQRSLRLLVPVNSLATIVMLLLTPSVWKQQNETDKWNCLTAFALEQSDCTHKWKSCISSVFLCFCCMERKWFMCW